MNEHKGLLAIDWGTSSFRLSALNASGKLLQQRISERGVAQMPRDDLQHFLQTEIASLPLEMRHLPVILCGMVGSSIGIQEVSYLPCPADPQQLAGALEPLNEPLEIQGTKLDTRIVPGLKARNDAGEREVMRGEESQIAGWLADADERQLQSSWLCLPGTHSKWARIKNGRVQHFRTAMTGELYAILKQHSVLVQGEQQFNADAFEAGLSASNEDQQLSFSLFSTRTRVLDQRLPQQNAAAYLSGLLIGSEVRTQLQTLPADITVHLIGDHHINDLYRRALAHCGIRSQSHDGADLALRGLRQLYLRSQQS